ncbi:MAG: PstS family phosphate ABC transporter substrate-binding protein, partial [Vibrio sp.]
DQIFSATLSCGGDKSITTWQQLGVTQDWGQLNIEKFGRNSASGTYGYFKKKVLCDGDYKANVNELAGASAVVQSVASATHSLGYSGVNNQVSNARLLPIAFAGNDFIAPSRANILSGRYPLARYLYIYVNKPPQKSLSRADHEFLRFILSKQGQEAAEKAGYLPLSYKIAREELTRLEMDENQP